MRRVVVLILIGLCAFAGAAACGSGGSGGAGGQTGGGSGSGGQSGGTAQVMTILRQLSRCIRAHGMPGFPDPIINPLTNYPDYPASAPRIPDSVGRPCQSIANRLPPRAQSSQPPTAQSMRGLVRFAGCMRSHGVPGWPDPNALGEFPMTAQMSRQFKTADQSAVHACIKYVPGGSQYLQFVGASGTGNG
jgi:hypothetical protein